MKQQCTFLSLIANDAREALGAEAGEGDAILAQYAGPSIQALAGVTEVTCSGSSDLETSRSLSKYLGYGAMTTYVLGSQHRKIRYNLGLKKPWKRGRQVNRSEQMRLRGHWKCGFYLGDDSFTEEGHVS